MLLRFQKPAVRENYETGNQAFSMRLRFLTIRGEVGGAAVLALGDLHEHTCYIEAHIFMNARTILTNLDLLLATFLTEILVSERFSHFEREVRLAEEKNIGRRSPNPRPFEPHCSPASAVEAL